jgi:hypothetical protein
MYCTWNLKIIAKQNILCQHFHILPVPDEHAALNYPTGRGNSGRGNSGHPSKAKFKLQLKLLVNGKIDL